VKGACRFWTNLRNSEPWLLLIRATSLSPFPLSLSRLLTLPNPRHLFVRHPTPLLCMCHVCILIPCCFSSLHAYASICPALYTCLLNVLPFSTKYSLCLASHNPHANDLISTSLCHFQPHARVHHVLRRLSLVFLCLVCIRIRKYFGCI
jgi:hypothetical protein